MNKQSILSRSEGVTYQNVADEVILIRMDTGTYFSLNKIGAEFWEMLDGKQTIQEHAHTIAAKYVVDPAMVLADLLELAGKMDADHLLIVD